MSTMERQVCQTGSGPTGGSGRGKGRGALETSREGRLIKDRKALGWEMSSAVPGMGFNDAVLASPDPPGIRPVPGHEGRREQR